MKDLMTLFLDNIVALTVLELELELPVISFLLPVQGEGVNDGIDCFIFGILRHGVGVNVE